MSAKLQTVQISGIENRAWLPYCDSSSSPFQNKSWAFFGGEI